MKVFKTYFKILKKHMVSILIYAGIFLMITIVSTKSSEKSGDYQFSAKKVPVLILNHDEKSGLIDGLLSYLKRYTVFIDIADNEEAKNDALFSRKVKYILTFPEGFSRDFLAGGEAKLIKQTVPDSPESVSVDTVINNYLNTAKVYLKYSPDIKPEELNSYINKDLETETSVLFRTKQKAVNISSNNFNNSYFNYLGYIIVSCFIIGVSNVMLSFHEIDIRRKHYITPITNQSFNFQLILANLVFVLGYLVIFIIAGFIVNSDRRIDTGTLLTWLNAFLYSLTVLSISYLVGITIKSKNAVQALATTFSLGFAFISGVFVPQEFLGASVLKIASFTPTYWYVKTNNMIEKLADASNQSFLQIMGCMAIQIGFAAAIISISLVVSKRKRQQEA